LLHFRNALKRSSGKSSFLLLDPLRLRRLRRLRQGESWGGESGYRKQKY
jgi:hypothetical protein